eukprot:1130792-Prorocentrum_minimum.AAC.1
MLRARRTVLVSGAFRASEKVWGEGELSYPVKKGLIKGLMAVWTPRFRTFGSVGLWLRYRRSGAEECHRVGAAAAGISIRVGGTGAGGKGAQPEAALRLRLPLLAPRVRLFGLIAFPQRGPASPRPLRGGGGGGGGPFLPAGPVEEALQEARVPWRPCRSRALLPQRAACESLGSGLGSGACDKALPARSRSWSLSECVMGKLMSTAFRSSC